MQATLVLHRRGGMVTSFGLVEGALPDEAYLQMGGDKLYLLELPDEFKRLSVEERVGALDDAAQASRSHGGFRGQVSEYPEIETQLKVGGRSHKQIKVR